MNVQLPGFVRRALDRWLLLRTAEAAAEALPSGRRAKVVALHRAGDTRVDAALGEHGVPALLLSRAAVPCYLEAVVTARASEELPRGARLEDLWARYDAIAAAGLVPSVPASLASARSDMTLSASPDSEIAEHGDSRVDEAIRLATFLGERTELRTPRAIQIERVLRAGAAVVIGFFLLAELVIHRPRPESVALHANVVASSRRPGSGPPIDLTNGKIETTLAFATKDEADPTVTVDLGRIIRISEVTLVNSDDHKDDSLPLRVETSPDGTAWDPAALQTAHFSRDAPAVLKFTIRGARFVRVHGRPSGAIYLNGIEVR